MELKVKGSFYRDLEKYSNKELAGEVEKLLYRMIEATRFSHIPHLQKLKKFEVHYRVKVHEDYRIGMVIRKNKITLVCFGHRHNFYNTFP